MMSLLLAATLLFGACTPAAITTQVGKTYILNSGDTLQPAD